MTPELETRLKSLQNYHTRYEVVGEHADGRKYLAGYTSRRNRTGLIKMVQQNGEAWLKMLGDCDLKVEKKDRQGRTTADHQLVAGEWRFYFTGRTQRECYIEGETAFILDVTA